MPPVAEIGAGKIGTGPVPIALAMENVLADHGDTGTYSWVMTVWTQCQNTEAGGTAETLQIEAGRKPAKVARHIAMSPETVMAAARARRRTLPRKILAKRKNILEYDGNGIYHQFLRLRVATPRETRAESSRTTLRPLHFRKIKWPPIEAK
jgi:hypothetical protein